MSPGSRFEAIVVGCSWGGMEALTELLGALPDTLCAPILVAQHRLEDSVPSSLAHLLSAHSSLPVGEADDREALEPGKVYLAPAGYHLLVERGLATLSTAERRNHSRPSVDMLFEAAADAYGPAVIAVILTGANDDGAQGVRAIKHAGGFVVAQDPEDAERREMPDAAITTRCVDRILPLRGIAGLLAAACGPSLPAAPDKHLPPSTAAKGTP